MRGADARSQGTELPEHLIVGHVTRVHGIKGELLVTPLTDRPDHVYAPGRTVRLGDHVGHLPPRAASLTVERARPHKGGLLIKFEEVPDRSAAELYTRRYLFADVESLAPVEEGELFYHQLLGLEVVTGAGEVVGRVREVYETVPSHLLEVKGDGKVHLVPLSRQVVRDVDLEERRIVIEPPPGLLEL